MIRLAICDDEKNFVTLEKQFIQTYMEKQGYQYQIDSFLSGINFLKLDEKIKDYDIIFLDINMEQLDGMEIAQRIREMGCQAYIVFVTAYITYAIEGYKVDASRYLLKESDSLELSIEECLDSIFQKMDYKEYREEFDFLEGKKTLSPDEIVYIESNLHKLIFHLAEVPYKKYSMYEKLDVLEQRLCSYDFCRIHKSFLVNLKYVREMERYTAKFKENVCDKLELNISQSKYKQAKNEFIFYLGEV